jgi:iron complex outermembrane receptor protein
VSGQASTRGIEADAAFNATQNLRFNAGLAYVDAHYDKFAQAPCYNTSTAPVAPGCTLATLNGTVVPVLNASGMTMPLSPKFKMTLGAEQRVPLTVIPYDVVLTGAYSYQTSEQMIYDENPQSILPAFGLLNLSAGLQEKTGRYSITLFVNNVLDQHYPVFAGDMFNSVWKANAVVVQPARDSNRYAGLRVAAAF